MRENPQRLHALPVSLQGVVLRRDVVVGTQQPVLQHVLLPCLVGGAAGAAERQAFDHLLGQLLNVLRRMLPGREGA